MNKYKLERITYREPLYKRLWRKTWFVWLLVPLTVVGAFYGFYWLIYGLVALSD